MPQHRIVKLITTEVAVYSVSGDFTKEQVEEEVLAQRAFERRQSVARSAGQHEVRMSKTHQLGLTTEAKVHIDYELKKDQPESVKGHH